jgi:hypothetical protein
MRELKKRSNCGLHEKCDVLAPMCFRREMYWYDTMFEHCVSWIRHAKIRNKGKIRQYLAILLVGLCKPAERYKTIFKLKMNAPSDSFFVVGSR